MNARYPAPTVGWAARLGDTPDGVAGAEWRYTLRGLSGEQIRQGLEADEKRGSDFPPSGPVFRRMALGIPKRRDAIASYQAGVVTPFTRLMRDHTDSWQLDRADYGQADRILAGAYEAAIADVERAGGLPASEAPPLPVPEPPNPRHAADKQTRSSAARDQALAECRLILGMPQPVAGA